MVLFLRFRATIVWKRASGLLYRRSHELTEYRTLMETTKSYFYFRFYTPKKPLSARYCRDLATVQETMHLDTPFGDDAQFRKPLSIASHYDDAGGLIMVVATTVGAQKTVLEQATNGPQHVRQQYAGRHGNTGEGRPRRRGGDLMSDEI